MASGESIEWKIGDMYETLNEMAPYNVYQVVRLNVDYEEQSGYCHEVLDIVRGEKLIVQFKNNSHRRKFTDGENMLYLLGR